MLTSDERFEIGMKFLQRFKPVSVSPDRSNLRPDGARYSQFPHAATVSESAELIDELEQPDLSSPEDRDIPQFGLAEILKQTGPLPPLSVILGVCEDKLPFLFDLTNPAPGSLLIVGDPGSGKTRLVKAILASARQLSKPQQLTFSIITPNASLFQDEMLSIEYCQHFVSPDEASSARLIENLAHQAENRRRSATPDQMVILLIDDLAACLQNLDDEQFRRLYWLIKHGPRSRIWVLATFDPASLDWMDERMIDAFRTRLIGSMLDTRLAAMLAGEDEFNLDELEAGQQFCVPFGDEWIRFWICDPS